MGNSLALWFAAALTGGACSDDGPGQGSGDVGQCDVNTKGFTECQISTCQPGQYCNDQMLSCVNGCLSDVNCACNQVCSKQPGVNEGVCVDKMEPSTTSGGEDPTTSTITSTSTETTADPTTSTTADPTTSTTASTTDPEDPKVICKDLCSTTDFFECYRPGGLQACFDRCDAATDAQIEQYYNCSATRVDCDALLECEKFLPAP